MKASIPAIEASQISAAVYVAADASEAVYDKIRFLAESGIVTYVIGSLCVKDTFWFSHHFWHCLYFVDVCDPAVPELSAKANIRLSFCDDVKSDVDFIESDYPLDRISFVQHILERI